MHVTRLLLYPAESGTTLYLQDTDQGFFFSKTSVSSTALREALAALVKHGVALEAYHGRQSRFCFLSLR